MAYAVRFRWHVFPAAPATKAPLARLVPCGFRDASNDPDQIVRWWTAEPTASVALACSASGLVVLDADLYKNECEFPALENRLGRLPETVRQLTPRGGIHFLFHDAVGTGYVNPCPGAETKHQGYILRAPSGHPDVAGIYRWDLGAHPIDTPIAELPDRWLAHLTTTPGKSLPSTGIDAADSWLGHAFAAMNRLGDVHQDGRRNVWCPWAREHSDGRGAGRDSSTVIFPRAVGATLGGFLCSHGHCSARTWRDVVAILPAKAKWTADQAVRQERNRQAYAQLDAMRRAG